MPTYDYECDSCGHHWELFQKITDDPVKLCPECGKKKATRQFGTGAAIVFKGSGFYQTDYRSESYKKDQKAAKESADESKTDSKSDGKTASKKSESGTSSSRTESTSSAKSDSKD